MSRASALGIAIGLLLALPAGGGCARHVHRDGPDVVVLDREHDDPAILIVTDRPGADRTCWKHRRHWHCRVR